MIPTHVTTPEELPVDGPIVAVVLLNGSITSAESSRLSDGQYNFPVVGANAMCVHGPSVTISVVKSTLLVDGSMIKTERAFQGLQYSFPVVGANAMSDHLLFPAFNVARLFVVFLDGSITKT